LADSPRTAAERRAKISRVFRPLGLFSKSAGFVPKMTAENFENSPRENASNAFRRTGGNTCSPTASVDRVAIAIFKKSHFSANRAGVGPNRRPTISTADSDCPRSIYPWSDSFCRNSPPKATESTTEENENSRIRVFSVEYLATPTLAGDSARYVRKTTSFRVRPASGVEKL